MSAIEEGGGFLYGVITAAVLAVLYGYIGDLGVRTDQRGTGPAYSCEYWTPFRTVKLALERPCPTVKDITKP